MSWFKRLRSAFALNRPRNPDPVELVSAGGLSVGRAAYRPSVLLRPANPMFIWMSLLVALVINLMPWGQATFVPDFVALGLIFWNVHQPRRVGIGAAFVFGLLMDVHNGALFGEHALAYTLLSYGAISLHRRILWFPLGAQALHVFGLLLVAQFASMLVRLWVGGSFPGLSYFAESLVGALVWPIVTWLLLAPQRQPHERDETRPI
jgi:rod shape-determining protein MreD